MGAPPNFDKFYAIGPRTRKSSRHAKDNQTRAQKESENDRQTTNERRKVKNIRKQPIPTRSVEINAEQYSPEITRVRLANHLDNTESCLSFASSSSQTAANGAFSVSDDSGLQSLPIQRTARSPMAEALAEELADLKIFGWDDRSDVAPPNFD